MTEESSDRRKSLQSRPTPRVLQGPRADAILLYDVGRWIPKGDRHDLQSLLDQFNDSMLMMTSKLGAQQLIPMPEDT